MSWWHDLNTIQVSAVGLGTALIGAVLGSGLTYRFNVKRLRVELAKDRISKLEELQDKITVISIQNDDIFRSISSGDSENVGPDTLKQMMTRVQQMVAVYRRYEHYVSDSGRALIDKHIKSASSENDVGLVLDFPRALEAAVGNDLRRLVRE